MIRVAIVDDNPRERAHLRTRFDAYLTQEPTDLSIEEFDSGEALVAAYTRPFDVVFLDVMMDGLDGFETADAIRRVDADAVLIFTTRVAELAVRGYDYDALSYLIKPVNSTMFGREFGRAVRRVHQRAPQSILLPAVAGAVRVRVADVIYLESRRHRIMVHTLGQTFAFTSSLKAFEDILDDQHFFRSNSCYLVNLRHVDELRKTSCVMTGGDELQISRSRRKGFAEALTDFVGNRW